eukprot:1996750-Prymnesium_polylepis.1
MERLPIHECNSDTPIYNDTAILCDTLYPMYHHPSGTLRTVQCQHQSQPHHASECFRSDRGETPPAARTATAAGYHTKFRQGLHTTHCLPSRRVYVPRSHISDE